MEVIFTTITNNPIERDETRSAQVIDYQKPYKNLKGSPDKSRRARGPAIPEVGSIYRSNGALPGVPSYSKIGNEMILPDPDNYLVKHKIEIIDNQVVFNGVVIASAPEPFKAKGKGKNHWTPARRLTFCKAVIYSIIPSETRVYQKDSNGKLGTTTIEDDGELRRYAALYPALIDNQMDDVREEMLDKLSIAALPGIIAAPEPIAISAPSAPLLTSPMELSKEDFDKCFKLVDPVLSIEEMTGYPSAEVVEDLLLRNSINYEVEIEEIESGYDYPEYDNVMTEFNTPAIEEIYEILNPVFIPEKVIVQNPLTVIRSWMHGSMMISEEVRA